MFKNSCVTGSEILLDICKDKNYDICFGDMMGPAHHVSYTLNIPVILANPMTLAFLDFDFPSLKSMSPVLQNFIAEEFSRVIWKNFVTWEKSIPFPNARFLIFSSKEIYSLGNTGFMGKAEFELLNKTNFFAGNRDFPELKNWSTDRTEISEKPPRVYISLGTNCNKNYTLYESLICAMEQLNYPTIISFGGAEFMYEYFMKRETKENITYKTFVNQKEVLCNSDIYFCHAGAGSIYEAFWYTVPMILIPQSLDQPHNANVINDLGLGIDLKWKDNENLVEDTVKAMKNMQENYGKLKLKYIEYRDTLLKGDNHDAVIRKIEKLMESDKEALMSKLPTIIE